MRLVAAAKVRRAQEAVLQTRPFSETLQSVFSGLIEQLGKEPLDLPLLENREVKKVTLLAISGDRGLCGSYNTYIIKKTEARKKELEEQGIEVEIVPVGDKVELIYTKFVSLIASSPSIRTILPLSATGIETEGDEIFEMSTKDGDFEVETTTLGAAEPKEFPKETIFEQDPVAILNGILPLPR